MLWYANTRGDLAKCCGGELADRVNRTSAVMTQRRYGNAVSKRQTQDTTESKIDSAFFQHPVLVLFYLDDTTSRSG